MSRLCQRLRISHLEVFREPYSRLEIPEIITEDVLLSLEQWLINHLNAAEMRKNVDFPPTVEISLKEMAIRWLREDNSKTIWWFSRPWENKQ